MNINCIPSYHYSLVERGLERDGIQLINEIASSPDEAIPSQYIKQIVNKNLLFLTVLPYHP